MTRLPDCPHCDADDTLEAISSDGKGVVRCCCSVCGRICRVNAGGAVVHVSDVRDVNGAMMDHGK